VYLFGTTAYPGDEHVIECCGCILVTDWRKLRTDEERAMVTGRDIGDVKAEDMEWEWAPVQQFRTVSQALTHLNAHVAAGHKVPQYAFSGIEDDDWLPQS